MINLNNLQKAVNDGDLQMLRQLDKFVEFYGTFRKLKNHDEENIFNLDKLMKGFNTNKYLIYSRNYTANYADIIADAKTIYYDGVDLVGNTL